MSKTLPLTQGELAVVDDADFSELSRWKWSYQEWKGQGRAFRNAGGRMRTMHRQLMGFPDGLVDHRNGDPLDNRRSNLRVVSDSQSVWNTRSTRGSTSKYKGVYRDRDRGRWAVQICVDRKKQALGRFDDEEDAARAYDVAARRLHGEFARLNFPEPGEQSALRA